MKRLSAFALMVLVAGAPAFAAHKVARQTSGARAPAPKVVQAPIMRRPNGPRSLNPQPLPP